MTQDIDTQTILANLEDVIERKDSWYIPINYTWEFLVNVPTYLYFFPREVAEVVPLDESQREKAEKARKWYRYHISEKDDDMVSTCEFSKSWSEMKVEPFRLLYRREFLDSCPERWNRESSIRLGEEMRRLDHVLFLSGEMAEKFIKRTCPLLSSCIERWKVLRALKEDLRIYNT